MSLSSLNERALETADVHASVSLLKACRRVVRCDEGVEAHQCVRPIAVWDKPSCTLIQARQMDAEGKM